MASWTGLPMSFPVDLHGEWWNIFPGEPDKPWIVLVQPHRLPFWWGYIYITPTSYRNIKTQDIYGYLSKSPFLMVKSAHHVGGILNLCWWKKAHWLRNFVEIVVGQSYHPLRTLGMCILYYIISIYLNLKPCSQKSLITSSVFKITPPSCACCFINHEHINLP